MTAHLRSYSGIALAAVSCAIFGACGGDRTGETSAAGEALDTAAGIVTRDDTGAAAAGTTAAAGDVGEMTEANIVALVNASNSAEVAAGQVARKQAQGAQVKTFARRMVDDHTAMEKEARSLAKRLNLTENLPARADADTMGLADLSGKSGAEFDQAYIAHEIEAHQKTLELVNNALGRTQNAELRQMLEKARPKVEAHLKAAQQLQQKAGS